MKKTLCSLTLLMATLLPVFAFAQITTGFPPYGTFAGTGGGIDTIDLSSLNIHLAVPLRSLGAGGAQSQAAPDLFSSSLEPQARACNIRNWRTARTERPPKFKTFWIETTLSIPLRRHRFLAAVKQRRLQDKTVG